MDPKELVKAGYDSIAPAYLDFISNLPSPNIRWVDKLLNSLPQRDTAHILELGCGNGTPCTKHMAEKVHQITANDISSAQLSLAKEKLAVYQNIAYVEGDMTALKFQPESFDAVTALYSLIHLPRAEQPNMLRLIHSWLKPDGLLLCNFDESEDAGSVMEDWLGTRMFKSSFSAEQSKKMVSEAGFELVDTDIVSTVGGKATVPFLWILARKLSATGA